MGFVESFVAIFFRWFQMNAKTAVHTTISRISHHNELPDCLVPYKHYEAEVIAGVLDEVILPDDLDSEDYPSFSTMLRWLQWFRENLQRMEGYLRTAGYQILNLGEDFLFSSDSLLDKIRNRYQNWLEQLLRLIYNSGGFLVPVRW